MKIWYNAYCLVRRFFYLFLYCFARHFYLSFTQTKTGAVKTAPVAFLTEKIKKIKKKS